MNNHLKSEVELKLQKQMLTSVLSLKGLTLVGCGFLHFGSAGRAV